MPDEQLEPRAGGRLRRILAEVDEDDPLWALEWLATAFRAMQSRRRRNSHTPVRPGLRRCSQNKRRGPAGPGRDWSRPLPDHARRYGCRPRQPRRSHAVRHCGSRRSASRWPRLLFGDFGLHGALRSPACAEWTRALAGWCDAQSGLVPYRGVCQIHRAEILHLLGSWTEAAEEAERARNRLASDSMIIGGAQYRLAELHVSTAASSLPSERTPQQQAVATKCSRDSRSCAPHKERQRLRLRASIGPWPRTQLRLADRGCWPLELKSPHRQRTSAPPAWRPARWWTRQAGSVRPTSRRRPAMLRAGFVGSRRTSVRATNPPTCVGPLAASRRAVRGSQDEA